jgi:fructose-1,6-bisphosphatase/inositol monophosphatase family enzyme
MADSTPDLDIVAARIREVAHALVLPKFRALDAAEVHPKPTADNADDIVTVVDRSVETALGRALVELVPASAVLGEEAAHATPSLVGLLAESAPVWIVDPLDGTHNFAGGHDGFGIMVGYAVRGQVRAAWVHLPAQDEMFVAGAGSGAFCNGRRVVVPPQAARDRPSGAVFSRFMPEPVRSTLLSQLEGRYRAVAHSGAAAVEYTRILRGLNDFALYYRLLPWDHAAPALILTEGGGTVVHLDGRPYRPQSPNQLTIVARDSDTAAHVRAWLT